jgi:hypothetical protein
MNHINKSFVPDVQNPCGIVDPAELRREKPKGKDIKNIW